MTPRSYGHGFWSQPNAMEIWQRDCAEAKAKSARTGKSAMDRAESSFDHAASALAEKLVENAADRYRRNPLLLDLIPGLAAWSQPETIISVCDSLRDEQQPRMVGFSGSVEPINLAGARRYAMELIAERNAAEVA